MSLEANREALRKLDALIKRFQHTHAQKAEGARFLRSDERSAALCEQVQLAHGYLRCALDALEGKPIEEAPSITAGDDAPDHTRVTRGGGEVSIPELIGTLHSQSESGVLTVSLKSETAELHFDGGALIHAFSHDSPQGQRLGEVLVRQGSLTEEQIGVALTHHRATGSALGQVLIQAGMVTTEQLAAALTEQVQELFARFWLERRARYEFQQTAPSGVTRAAWNVDQLLAQGASRSSV